ncbi:hypothetical protein HMPREF9397_1875, partial [Streptococcus sanguinis SK1087]
MELQLQLPSTFKIIRAKENISKKDWEKFFDNACHKKEGNY